MLYVVPVHVTQLPRLRRAEVRTISGISDFTRISRQALFTCCCNTSMSLTDSEYTKAFKCPHSKECRGSCRSVDRTSTSHPLSTERLVQVLSENVEKMRCCSIMQYPHGLSLMKRHILSTSNNTGSFPAVGPTHNHSTGIGEDSFLDKTAKA
jgi:hypothetical protein